MARFTVAGCFRSRIRGAARLPSVFAALALVVIAAAVGAAWAQRQMAPVRPGDRAWRSVTIPRGANAEMVGRILSDAGLVRSRFAIPIAARLYGGAGELRAGDYDLSAGQSAVQMLRQMEGGRTVSDLVIVPEGFTLEQVAQRLQDRHVGSAASFLKMARTEGRTFHCRDGFTPPDRNMQGFLFPDGYDFAPGESLRAVIQAMLDRFDEAVVKSNPAVTDWRRPVIVASMIEREAEAPKDRPLISAVIYNRLARNMPLQIDATVEYALPAHKARLMFSDLRVRSPYNTYLHRGLPPGPICEPGLPSIEAALHPASVDFLYYVSGPQGGAHRFSRTLSEQDHNIAQLRSAQLPG